MDLGSASKPDQTLHRNEDHMVSDRTRTEGVERSDTEGAPVNVAMDVHPEELAEDRPMDGAEEVREAEDLQTGDAR